MTDQKASSLKIVSTRGRNKKLSPYLLGGRRFLYKMKETRKLWTDAIRLPQKHAARSLDKPASGDGEKSITHSLNCFDYTSSRYLENMEAEFQKDLFNLGKTLQSGADPQGPAFFKWLQEEESQECPVNHIQQILDLAQSYWRGPKLPRPSSSMMSLYDEKSHTFRFHHRNWNATVHLHQVTDLNDMLAMMDELNKEESDAKFSNIRVFIQSWQDQTLYSLVLAESNELFHDKGSNANPMFCRANHSLGRTPTWYMLPVFCSLEQHVRTVTKSEVVSIVNTDSKTSSVQTTTTSQMITRTDDRKPNVDLLYVSERARKMGLGTMIVKLLNVTEVKQVAREEIPFWYSCSVKIKSLLNFY